MVKCSLLIDMKFSEYYFPRHFQSSFSKSMQKISKGFPKCSHIPKRFKGFPKSSKRFEIIIKIIIIIIIITITISMSFLN